MDSSQDGGKPPRAVTTAHPRSLRALALGGLPWGLGGALVLGLSTAGLRSVASSHPSAPDSTQTASGAPLIKSSGSVDSEHNVYENVPKGETLIDAHGNVIFLYNHVHFGPTSWPDATDVYKSSSNHQLIGYATSLSQDIKSYDKANPNLTPNERNRYYVAHYADKALKLSSEMLLRLGPRNWGSNPPAFFTSGSIVVKEKMTVGPFPLQTASYFLATLAHNMPDDGNGR